MRVPLEADEFCNVASHLLLGWFPLSFELLYEFFQILGE